MQTNHPFLPVGRSDNIEAFSVNHPIGYALETIAGEPCPGNEPNDAMASVLESLRTMLAAESSGLNWMIKLSWTAILFCRGHSL